MKRFRLLHRLIRVLTGKRNLPGVRIVKLPSSSIPDPDMIGKNASKWNRFKRALHVNSGMLALNPPLHKARLAALSPDGKFAIVVELDGEVRIWDLMSWEPLFPSLQGTISTQLSKVAFSSDGKRAIGVGTTSGVHVWDIMTRALLFPPLPPPLGGVPSDPGYGHVDPAEGRTCEDAVLAADGIRILVMGRFAVQVWDSFTGNELSRPWRPDSNQAICYSMFNVDGTRALIVGMNVWSGWYQARVWNPITGMPVSDGFAEGIKGAAPSVVLSPDGNRVIVAGDISASIRDAITNKIISGPWKHTNSNKHKITSVAFSRDGTRVVSSSEDNSVRVWDAMSAEPLSPWLWHRGPVVSATFSRDGMTLVTASEDKTTRVWDVASGEQLALIKHERSVSKAIFSVDGQRIITTDYYPATVRIWDATTGESLTPSLLVERHPVLIQP